MNTDEKQKMTLADGVGGGNEDTLRTGMSGVVILGAVIWIVSGRSIQSRPSQAR